VCAIIDLAAQDAFFPLILCHQTAWNDDRRYRSNRNCILLENCLLAEATISVALSYTGRVSCHLSAFHFAPVELILVCVRTLLRHPPSHSLTGLRIGSVVVTLQYFSLHSSGTRPKRSRSIISAIMDPGSPRLFSPADIIGSLETARVDTVYFV
jgi:hypothetical protein